MDNVVFSQEDFDLATAQLVHWIHLQGGRIRVNDLGLFYLQFPQFKGAFNGKLRQLTMPPQCLFAMPDAATLELRSSAPGSISPKGKPLLAPARQHTKKTFYYDVNEFKLALQSWGPVSVLGVDIKGDIRRDGTISFVQLASARGECISLDVLLRNAGQVLEQCGVKQLLESHDVLKVMHDSAKPSDAFQSICGIRINNVWDTFTCFDLLLRQNAGIVAPTSRGVVQVMNFFNVRYHGQSKPEYREGWFRRPLTQDQVDYAGEGVVHLPGLVLERMARMANDCGVLLDCRVASEQHLNSLRVPPPPCAFSLFSPIHHTWDQCKRQVDERDMEKWFV